MKKYDKMINYNLQIIYKPNLQIIYNPDLHLIQTR